MKQDDPKRLKARENLDRAELWFEIIAGGIGHALIEQRIEAPEVARRLIGHVNRMLVVAVEGLEAANKAYEPYRRRWRIRIRRAPAPKPAKAKPAVN